MQVEQHNNTHLSLSLQNTSVLNDFLQEDVPFGAFGHQGIDLRRGSFEVFGVVEPGFERATDLCVTREYRRSVIVERHFRIINETIFVGPLLRQLLRIPVLSVCLSCSKIFFFSMGAPRRDSIQLICTASMRFATGLRHALSMTIHGVDHISSYIGHHNRRFSRSIGPIAEYDLSWPSSFQGIVDGQV